MITMTPQARAIAAFALAFALLTGALNRIGIAIVFLLDLDVGSRSQGVVAALVTILVGVGILWLAARAAAGTEAGWAGSLAEASRLLAVVGIAIAGLSLLASIAQGSHAGGFAFLGL